MNLDSTVATNVKFMIRYLWKEENPFDWGAKKMLNMLEERQKYKLNKWELKKLRRMSRDLRYAYDYFRDEHGIDSMDSTSM